MGRPQAWGQFLQNIITLWTQTGRFVQTVRPHTCSLQKKLHRHEIPQKFLWSIVSCSVMQPKTKKEHVREILNETLGAAYTQHLTPPSPWTLTQCPYRNTNTNTTNAIIFIKVYGGISRRSLSPGCWAVLPEGGVCKHEEEHWLHTEGAQTH